MTSSVFKFYVFLVNFQKISHYSHQKRSPAPPGSIVEIFYSKKDFFLFSFPPRVGVHHIFLGRGECLSVSVRAVVRNIRESGSMEHVNFSHLVGVEGQAGWIFFRSSF